MEIVRDNGGQMDVFRLDAMTDYDFGHTLAVIKAGEMLDFLDTPQEPRDADAAGKRSFSMRTSTLESVRSDQQLQKLGVFRFRRADSQGGKESTPFPRDRSGRAGRPSCQPKTSRRS